MRSSLGEGPDGPPGVRGHPLSGPMAMQGIGAGPAAGAAMAAANVSSVARRLTSQEANGHGVPDGGGPSPGRSTVSGGSPQTAAGLSASATLSPEPVPYVSTFGSLPSQLAGSSEKASGEGRQGVLLLAGGWLRRENAAAMLPTALLYLLQTALHRAPQYG